uniref:hypothetical protein n=1 Tax=Phocaeicola sp. TaxID=2773926 RepID=UPI003FEF7E86
KVGALCIKKKKVRFLTHLRTPRRMAIDFGLTRNWSRLTEIAQAEPPLKPQENKLSPEPS